MAAGDFVWDAGLPFHLRGVPDESVGISVDTRSVAALTAEALRAHKSQWSLSLLPVPDDVLVRSLRTEDRVVAWPSSPPGAILSDVFEGL
jgi:hypothetical protein